MPGKYERYSAGQRMPLPAAAQINAWTEAAEDFAKRRKQGTPATPLGAPRDTDVIRVRNLSGGARLEGEVLRVGEPIIDTLDRFHIWHEGLICNGCGDWGVVIRAMPYDGIDQLQVSGVCLALVDVTEEGHTWADEKIGETHLVSDTQGGAKILWKESGIGLKVAVVNLGPHPRLGLFLLGGEWEANGGGSSSGEPCAPSGWMRMEDCSPIMFFDGACAYAPHSEPLTVWHAAGYLGQLRGDLLELGALLNYVLPKFGCGDYVWCFWNDHECRWQIIGPPEDHIRFELSEPLVRGGSAAAKLRILLDGSYFTTDVDLTVYDAHELVDACNGFALGYGIAKWMNDGCRLEVIGIGNFCEDSSSSSSSGCPLTFDYDRVAVDGCVQTITHMRLTHDPYTCETSIGVLGEETYSGCPSPSATPCEFTIDYDTVSLGSGVITVTHRRKTVDLAGCDIVDSVLSTESLNIADYCCYPSSSSSGEPSSSEPSSSSSSVCCECPLAPAFLTISGTNQNDGTAGVAYDSNPSANIWIYKVFLGDEVLHVKIDCSNAPDSFDVSIAVGADPAPEAYSDPVAITCGQFTASGVHSADFGDGDGIEDFGWDVEFGWSLSCPNLEIGSSSSSGGCPNDSAFSEVNLGVDAMTEYNESTVPDEIGAGGLAFASRFPEHSGPVWYRQDGDIQTYFWAGAPTETGCDNAEPPEESYHIWQWDSSIPGDISPGHEVLCCSDGWLDPDYLFHFTNVNVQAIP